MTDTREEQIARIIAFAKVGDPNALDRNHQPRWKWFLPEAKNYLRFFPSAILSTEAAPSEPVAWRWCNIFNKDHWIVSTEEPATHNEQYIVEPLYAHPPATKSNNGESK